MAKGKTCIIYRNREGIYLNFDSMADAGRYLGYKGDNFRKIIESGVAYKGWLLNIDLGEDWFIRNGFRKTKKIEGGYSNAKIVRIVPKEDPNKELDEFVKTLKLGIES